MNIDKATATGSVKLPGNHRPQPPDYKTGRDFPQKTQNLPVGHRNLHGSHPVLIIAKRIGKTPVKGGILYAPLLFIQVRP